jgi:hypothetical protein
MWLTNGGDLSVLGKISTSASPTSAADLINKAYLESQLTYYAPTTSLTSYLLITDFNTVIAGYVSNAALTTALNNYVLSSALTTTLSGYVSNSALTSALAPYALTTALNNYVLSSSLTTTDALPWFNTTELY